MTGQVVTAQGMQKQHDGQQLNERRTAARVAAA
jgi:hypothetical protein